MNRTRIVAWFAGGGILVFLLLQAVPYGRDHANPPVADTPVWDSPRTEALARGACFDCHSNESRWPWYASVAPASWRIQSHVDGGRRELNFSDLGRSGEEAGEAAEMVLSGEMPPWDYALMHPEAQLTPELRRELAAGLRSTFGPGEGGDAEADDDEAGD